MARYSHNVLEATLQPLLAALQEQGACLTPYFSYDEDDWFTRFKGHVTPEQIAKLLQQNPKIIRSRDDYGREYFISGTACELPYSRDESDDSEITHVWMLETDTYSGFFKSQWCICNFTRNGQALTEISHEEAEDPRRRTQFDHDAHRRMWDIIASHHGYTKLDALHIMAGNDEETYYELYGDLDCDCFACTAAGACSTCPLAFEQPCCTNNSLFRQWEALQQLFPEQLTECDKIEMTRLARIIRDTPISEHWSPSDE